MSTPVVRLSDLSFGPENAPVLDQINLSLETGHFMGIIGPNGAGKSTLLSAIAGLIQPSCGTVELFGKPLNQFNRHKLLKKVARFARAAPINALARLKLYWLREVFKNRNRERK